MKTTVKQLAAGTFIALLLLVVNVKAEGTEKTASTRENIEITLQLENWMTDETIWNTKFTGFGEIYQETETSLQLESWMTSEETWNTNDMNSDAGLTIEDWMTDNKIWK